MFKLNPWRIIIQCNSNTLSILFDFCTDNSRCHRFYPISTAKHTGCTPTQSDTLPIQSLYTVWAVSQQYNRRPSHWLFEFLNKSGLVVFWYFVHTLPCYTETKSNYCNSFENILTVIGHNLENIYIHFCFSLRNI